MHKNCDTELALARLSDVPLRDLWTVRRSYDQHYYGPGFGSDDGYGFGYGDHYSSLIGHGHGDGYGFGYGTNLGYGGFGFGHDAGGGYGQVDGNGRSPSHDL